MSVTAPGQYAIIEEHIATHRYLMGQDLKRDISDEEAVAHWYDHVYLPIVEIIRERVLLRDFPQRTETDLYLWISEHRAALEKEMGWLVRPEDAASHLAARFSLRPRRLGARLGEKLLDMILPESLDAGPPPGKWREERASAHRDDRLFLDVLVSVEGTKDGWLALEQALIVARREESRLHGLYTARRIQEDSPEPRSTRASFEQRCREAGVDGSLGLASGNKTRKIYERARWSDLVIFNLDYSPDPVRRVLLDPVSGKAQRALIQRCPAPLLVVPYKVSPLSRALLAYDGSPKSEEALYVAAYLAGQWAIPLTVVSILQEGRVTSETQALARAYLEEHGVQATFTAESGPVVPVILLTAEEHQSDLIIMGGYGRGPLLNVFIDDVVDEVLRQARKPVLLCR